MERKWVEMSIKGSKKGENEHKGEEGGGGLLHLHTLQQVAGPSFGDTGMWV